MTDNLTELTPNIIFTRLVDQITSGNQHEFSKLVKKPYSQINGWHTGNRNISFSILLEMFNILQELKYKLDFNKLFK